MRVAGFPPIIGKQPRVLILGSMPSEASLNAHQYYAHPRNAFWPIMGQLFEFDPGEPYQQRCQYLIQQHIAVWDVIASCTRQGSMDSAIESKSIQTNDFFHLLGYYPTIRYIFFNGGKAEQEFKRRVLADLKNAVPRLAYKLLPSTSPANARLSQQQKLSHWIAVKCALAG